LPERLLAGIQITGRGDGLDVGIDDAHGMAMGRLGFW
jgi:hypothetical protein